MYNSKIFSASTWSFVTQIIYKIIPPLSTMILARVFTPDVFGIIATITMVISFCESISESGFQKYIITKKYKDQSDYIKDLNVAFWCNIVVSLLLWGLVAFFSEGICKLLGSEEIKSALIFAFVQLPITGLSSLQIAVFQKEYDFKTPFYSQLMSSIVTLLLTVILALYTNLGFWVVLVGNIIGCIVRTIVLSLRCDWTPSLYYSYSRFKELIQFSFLISAESVAVWCTSWIDSFVISNQLSSHDLGIYKNSQSIVNGILAIPQNTITNVLIVSLSKNSSNNDDFNNIYLVSQKLLAYILLPLGVGIFFYRDLAVKIAFGNGWEESEYVVALWTIASIFRILLVSLSSVVFISKGLPRIALYMQLIDLIILVPVCFYGASYGLRTFTFFRSLARIDIVLPCLICVYYVCRLDVIKILCNLFKPLLTSIVFALLLYCMRMQSSGIVFDLISIFLGIIVYIGLLLLLAKDDLKNMWSSLKNGAV